MIVLSSITLAFLKICWSLFVIMGMEDIIRTLNYNVKDDTKKSKTYIVALDVKVQESR